MIKDEDKIYGWPVKAKLLEGFSPLESPVHRGVPKLLCACDFIVPLNTPVLAMENGIVSFVKQDSNKGGNDLPNIKRAEDSKFYYAGNRIEICHGNNEFSAYEHLALNGVLVRKREFVKKGQTIALTGYTGLMAHLGPHLHVERFHWFGPGEEDYVTIPISWERENMLYTPHPQGFLWNREKWRKTGNSRELRRGA